jgi:hypothetical protein
MHCVFLDRQSPPHAFLAQQPEGIFVVDAAIAHQIDDLDRLAISPQCGFASTVAGNPVSEADQRAKLRLVVTAADAIWS